MLGDVNKLFVFNSLLTTPNNVLPLNLKETFPPKIWILREIRSIELAKITRLYQFIFRAKFLLRFYKLWMANFFKKIIWIFLSLMMLKDCLKLIDQSYLSYEISKKLGDLFFQTTIDYYFYNIAWIHYLCLFHFTHGIH